MATTYTAPKGSNSPATASAKKLARNLAGALKTARKAAKGTSAALKKNTPAKKSAVPAKKPTASASAALLPKYDQPLESYSAYAQHRILLEKHGTDEAGQAKVFKHGTAVLGLPESQVKTYIREKINAIARDMQKAAGLHPSKPQLEKAKTEPDAFEPHFRYTTKDAAMKAMMARARQVGVLERAFHIISEGGKFAFVPAHVRPHGKPPTFEKGDIVMDTGVKDSRAVIKEAGPEQSTIVYETERKYAPKEQTISNFYLVKVAAAKAPAAAKKASKPAAKKAAKKAK